MDECVEIWDGDEIRPIQKNFPIHEAVRSIFFNILIFYICKDSVNMGMDMCYFKFH